MHQQATAAQIAETPRRKFGRVRAQARAAYVARDNVVDGILIAMLADLSCLLVGEPGTAKSHVARTIAESITDAKRFFLQLNPTTVPESVFGGVDVARMAEKGEWRRRYQNHLPAANVVVLDEVFRSSSAILDSLLKAINEKKYEDDGGEVDIPMELLVGTSNTVPDDPHLAAFYDRWALRFFVEPPKTEKEMARIFDMEREPSISATLTMADVHAAQAEVAQVAIPKALTKTVAKVWRELQVAGFDVSARKFRWVKRMARARAWLHGRDEVTVDDLDIIADCAWDNPADRSAILRVVINASCPAAAEAVEALDLAVQKLEAIPELEGHNEGAVATAGAAAREKIAELTTDVEKLRDEAAPHERGRLDQILSEMQSVQTRVLRRMQDLARGR